MFALINLIKHISRFFLNISNFSIWELLAIMVVQNNGKFSFPIMIFKRHLFFTQCKCNKVFSSGLPPQPTQTTKHTQASQNQSEAQLGVLRSSANIYTVLYRTPEYCKPQRKHTMIQSSTVQDHVRLCDACFPILGRGRTTTNQPNLLKEILYVCVRISSYRSVGIPYI